jgi:hypothetical protein
MMDNIELVARFLEDFAYQVEDEGRARNRMLPKTDVSWQGFTADAEKLIRQLQPS